MAVSRRFSARVIMTARTEEILYRRRLIAIEEKGIPIDVPRMNFVAMSHQTGAQLITLLCQMMELIPQTNVPSPDHIMNMHVPMFHAKRLSVIVSSASGYVYAHCACQYSGIMHSTKVIIDTAEKTTFVSTMAASSIKRERAVALEGAGSRPRRSLSEQCLGGGEAAVGSAGQNFHSASFYGPHERTTLIRRSVDALGFAPSVRLVSWLRLPL